ncbi:iron uptake transporter deferrochelatase/peroxidase subunit [Lichenihabitans psoromatis]|uniref:iron uptake transporter deferrochelatase/peroxidase subunit n=1 Tax=Lichenihabitans psoromatis TaxID=2528642 RepID=UPI001FE2276E|nr:iron uptake transporter deferrochelatase/peroxidase subunit [Lichenihabitans psoromatis]
MMVDRPAGTCPFGFASVTGHDATAGGPSLGRRRMLLGLGAAGTALGIGAAKAAPTPVETAPVVDNDGTRDRQPFYGPRQSGVVTAQPAAALIVAFDVLGTARPDLQRLFKHLTKRIAFLMRGGPAATAAIGLPPPDSGLMGPDVYPDNITITVAVGASLFDERFGLAAEKPKHLVTMTRFPNDALVAEQCHGDLLLQICSNTAETNIHALRDILKSFPDLLALRWKMEGFLPPHTLKTLGKDTVRNMLGFKDGTANLDAHDETLMDRIVWTGEQHAEPAWAKNGTYQVVRLIRTLVERWDRTPLGEQQTIIGREKATGAPLGMVNERDTPDYASDPQGLRIPVDAHIRLANPRTPETDKNLILRRPFNYSRGMTNAGQLDIGLLFVSFQADLEAGFITVQRRLDGEPLEEYIKPVGGGYFFVMPGVEHEDSYLGQRLVEGSA